MSTAQQVKKIHTLATKAGLDKADYRAFLRHHTGHNSSKALSIGDAITAIEALQRLPGASAPPKSSARDAATTATGKYAPLLQALWLSAWNLGIVRSKDDAAMLAFVRKQAKVAHTRFLVDADAAMPAIEGLKAWIARAGGVAWPVRDDDPLARKQAVCRAIAARLQATGGFTPFAPGTDVWPVDIAAYGYRRGLPAGFEYYDAGHWDALAGMLGARLRATLAENARKERANG